MHQQIGQWQQHQDLADEGVDGADIADAHASKRIAHDDTNRTQAEWHRHNAQRMRSNRHHNTVLLDKVSDNTQRLWYAEACRKNGWFRNVLIHQIESSLYERQVLSSKISNFAHRLPAPQSELAMQTIKAPYVFDCIPFREDMLERDIEQAA